MLTLKDYQVETLDALRRFLEDARVSDPASAFDAMLAEPERRERLGRFADRYRPLGGLADVPYVCLRLPTGGGKTLLAAHAVAVARDAWIERDFPVVLWLVPTKTIRAQTVDALKRPGHPYREALDAAFGGRVRVFDVSEVSNIRPQDVGESLCVVVATIQTLRVGDKEGRKVYAHNEDFQYHFARVDPNTPGLDRVEKGPGAGGVRYSFANLLRVNRPLMIVDEAHNAVTDLSRDMQAFLKPCAVIEFTATPRPRSNTLHNVAALELKREEMIKLPIVLSEHSTWENAVAGALATREWLAETARREGEALRPIILFQAQDKGREVTVDVLKTHLMEVEGIAEAKIKIATGEQRELDGLNLLDPACPVECVITVEALREGWDCSFAYVFCSLANVHNSGNVEQLLGRVLRLPGARRRRAEALNRAYAHVSESSFAAAASALRDRLIDMGFDEREAEDSVESEAPRLPGADGADGEGMIDFPKITTSVRPSFDGLDMDAYRGVRVRDTSDGRVEIAVLQPIGEAAVERIMAALPEPVRDGFREGLRVFDAAVEAARSPAERGLSFVVPALYAWVQGEFELAEADLFEGNWEWDLADLPARLDEFSLRDETNNFEIDLDEGGVFDKFVSNTVQTTMDFPESVIPRERFIGDLVRMVQNDHIGDLPARRWFDALLGDLTERRGFSFAELVRNKFPLVKAARARFAEFLRENRRAAFQGHLFGPDARLEVRFDRDFEFRAGMFFAAPRYQGKHRFAKHFLPHVPAFDGAPEGEEYRCALAIDRLSAVKHWVRNVSRDPAAFWLPTATDRFYPDFVAELTDGRILVVDYKSDRDEADTREKQRVGELWERASGGRGLFMIVKAAVEGRDPHAQMSARVDG